MSWGEPFRQAWQQARPGAQAAARDVALDAERAAGAMSESMLHALQLAQFAAQDLQRLQDAGSQAAPAPPALPGMSSLRRALDEVRQGRVPPEKAEKHLQQVIRTTSEEIRKASISHSAASTTLAVGELDQARRRFQAARAAFARQLLELRDAILADAGAGSAQDDPLQQLGRLAQAQQAIGRLFIDNKRVDDPVAPLPGLRTPKEH